MKIRKAKVSDLKDIILAQKEGWIFAHVSDEYNITEEDILKHLGPDEDLERRFKKFIEGGTPYYVVEVDGKVMGYCGCYQKDDYWTGAIYLRPSIIGNGIGMKLFPKMLEDIGEGNVFVVEIAEYNTRSISLFEKLGFELQKEKVNYVLNGSKKEIPLVIMRRVI